MGGRLEIAGLKGWKQEYCVCNRVDVFPEKVAGMRDDDDPVAGTHDPEEVEPFGLFRP
ncbi:hypothetical protein GCM10007880_64340 [Mesorhizobium amorphae]|nr:hypothetical protein GCM10007880_64340 [Mesorhizobium amorphae]